MLSPWDTAEQGAIELKQCIVLSHAYSFLRDISAMLEEDAACWQLHEAVSYEDGLELGRTTKAELMLVDAKALGDPPEWFLAGMEPYVDHTWLVVTGSSQTYRRPVMQLEQPIHRESLAFYLSNTVEMVQAQQVMDWSDPKLAHVQHILLDHFWSGLLHGWLRADRTMLIMAAQGIFMPGLEQRAIQPVLVRTIHQNKVQESHSAAAQVHLYFEELLSSCLLSGQETGAVMDRFDQKWAVILYGMQSPEQLQERCAQAIRRGKEDGWILSFYLGNSVLPEQLPEEWQLLEQLSQQNVGLSSEIRAHTETLQKPVAALPDMTLWGLLLEQGKFQEVAKQTAEYVMNLAQENRLDLTWLRSFRRDLTGILYRGMQTCGIPAHVGFPAEESETFRRGCATAPLLVGWIQETMGRCQQFLTSETADTPVKKAQKYILQHMDQELNRESIAAHVYVSGGYLGRLFKQELHLSISEYIFTERMKLAAQLLEQTDQYVTSIAVRVGYSNFPYFSTQFKKYSGLTPVEYRNRMRQGKAAE